MNTSISNLALAPPSPHPQMLWLLLQKRIAIIHLKSTLTCVGNQREQDNGSHVWLSSNSALPSSGRGALVLAVTCAQT